ncbi:MAG: HisS family protein [SAR202 cluster bacterium]|jgi:histidyl-tRNA synthetase|nr:HisS family protein [SAR202 cluster bacterium]|tara:strand:+ start:947 stop:2176 length:1230 start_codon:yes stop_codon:yes gene_type:complete
MDTVGRLTGMRDWRGADLNRANSMRARIGAATSAAGYIPIETPVLEQVELFVRKSGGEISSSLYSFTDADGVKIALRPEFTSSVIRHYVENCEPDAGPMRFSYGGPVFRHDYGEGGAYRQFTQAGAELVGDSSPAADAEILNLASECLRSAGLGDSVFTIGHLGLMHRVLESFRLSEPVKLFVIANLGRIAHGDGEISDLLARAQTSGLINDGGELTFPGVDSDEQVQEMLLTLFGDSLAAPLGRRTPEQIVARLVRKARDATDPESFNAAVSLASELGRLNGDPADVLDVAAEVLSKSQVQPDVLEEMRATITHLSDMGFPMSQTTLDLSFARGIAYYTGMVFEAHVTRGEDRVAVGGGGRYDDLVQALGGGNVPALGFAFTIEQILAANESLAAARGVQADGSSNDV